MSTIESSNIIISCAIHLLPRAAHARARGYVIGRVRLYIYIYIYFLFIYQFVTIKNTSSRFIGNYWLCR